MIMYYKNGVKYRIEEANMCKHCVRDGNCRFADDYKKRVQRLMKYEVKFLETFLCEYFTLDEVKFLELETDEI